MLLQLNIVCKIAICNLFICTNYSIPVGKNNRYGHPNKDVLNNLKESKIYRTDQDGSVLIGIKNKIHIETYVP